MVRPGSNREGPYLRLAGVVASTLEFGGLRMLGFRLYSVWV